MDKALTFIAVQDISEQHRKEKEEEKELTKLAKSKAVILVMAIMLQVAFLNVFLHRNSYYARDLVFR